MFLCGVVFFARKCRPECSGRRFRTKIGSFLIRGVSTGAVAPVSRFRTAQRVSARQLLDFGGRCGSHWDGFWISDSATGLTLAFFESDMARWEPLRRAPRKTLRDGKRFQASKKRIKVLSGNAEATRQRGNEATIDERTNRPKPLKSSTLHALTVFTGFFLKPSPPHGQG